MKSKSTLTTEELPPLSLIGEGGGQDFTAGEPERYVATGIKPLDDLILGVVAGEMTLIAGAPGQGKTSLATQVLLTAAQDGRPAALLSLEMGRRAVRNRLVSSLTGIDMRTLRTREWESKKQQAQAVEAAEFLASIPLYVDDRSGLGPEAVYETITAWGKRGIEIGAVDYLQQMGGTGDNRVSQVGAAARAVKDGAKDADIPVICISSLNRNANSREDKRPRLSDLRDSGDIEFVIDTCLMFHYPEDDLMEDIRVCDIHVLKQRNGPTGIASCEFDKPKTMFRAR